MQPQDILGIFILNISGIFNKTKEEIYNDKSAVTKTTLLVQQNKNYYT